MGLWSHTGGEDSLNTQRAVSFTARLGLFLFDLDDLAALVEAAVWANPVRQAHFAAVRALH